MGSPDGLASTGYTGYEPNSIRTVKIGLTHLRSIVYRWLRKVMELNHQPLEELADLPPGDCVAAMASRKVLDEAGKLQYQG